VRGNVRSHFLVDLSCTGLLQGDYDDEPPYGKGSLMHGAGGHGSYAGYPPNAKGGQY
jgi:hypothetical protein